MITHARTHTRTHTERERESVCVCVCATFHIHTHTHKQTHTDGERNATFNRESMCVKHYIQNTLINTISMFTCPLKPRSRTARHNWLYH